MLSLLRRGFIVTIAAVIAYVAYTRLKPRPISTESLHTDGQFVLVEGLQIHYRVAGSGPPLILIHGIFANLFGWRHVFDQLAKEHTVYALDLKGHGLSDKPANSDYSPFGMADLIAHFMDALGIESAAVLGQSMGGAIAAALAVRHPTRVQRLVLVDAAGYALNYHIMPLLTRVAGSAAAGFVFRHTAPHRGLAARLLRNCYYEPDRTCTPDVVDGYFLPLLTPGASGVIAPLARDFGQTSIAHRLREIQAPTLIIWGQYDAVIPMHWGYRFQKDIANAELVVFPKCGHCPHEEEPEKFLETVNGFLQRADSVDTGQQSESSTAANT
ncbi:MAG: alpha/beta fold hydrolase [Chloroflexi bacterium]|nr:alpha/beta fold hydrolase [Chloroflexota bacterium]